MCMAPGGTQSNRTTSTTRCSTGRAINCQMAPKANTMAMNTLPGQMMLTAALFRRRPKSSMVAAPASGNSGISQICARKNSGGMEIQSLRPRPVPVNAYHFKMSISSASTVSRLRKNAMMIPSPTAASAAASVMIKDGEDLPFDRTHQPRKRHQVDVHGVQDQFDGHQNNDDVAARDHAHNPDGEQRQAQEQVMPDRNHLFRPSSWP